ncbi:MAG: hypothetical protein HC794_07720 [Nitrospiraceae bacterium]|nr:hypothetical protein [Nitrospiraceae bacterium]
MEITKASLFVWRNFSTDFWVSFKVFGIMPITFAFALAQVGLLKKYDVFKRYRVGTPKSSCANSSK